MSLDKLVCLLSIASESLSVSMGLKTPRSKEVLDHGIDLCCSVMSSPSLYQQSRLVDACIRLATSCIQVKVQFNRAWPQTSSASVIFACMCCLSSASVIFACMILLVGDNWFYLACGLQGGALNRAQELLPILCERRAEVLSAPYSLSILLSSCSNIPSDSR